MMKTKTKGLLAALLLVVLAAQLSCGLSGDTRPTNAVNQLHDKESCYQTCSKTYSLHTYPKVSIFETIKTLLVFFSLTYRQL